MSEQPTWKPKKVWCRVPRTPRGCWGVGVAAGGAGVGVGDGDGLGDAGAGEGVTGGFTPCAANIDAFDSLQEAASR